MPRKNYKEPAIIEHYRSKTADPQHYEKLLDDFDGLLRDLHRWIDNAHQVIDANGHHYETELLGTVAAIEHIYTHTVNHV